MVFHSILTSPPLLPLPCVRSCACSTNHLGHFLLVNLLLEDLKQASRQCWQGPAGWAKGENFHRHDSPLRQQGLQQQQQQHPAKATSHMSPAHPAFAHSPPARRPASPPPQAPANNPAKRPRCIIVGSITGNTNTLAGNVPPKADLGDLRGLSAGLDGRGSGMIDGGAFDGAKAYKDSKVGILRPAA